MRKTGLVLALVAVGLLALGACAPRPTPSPQAPQVAAIGEWEKTLERAKKEGTVVVYMGLGADVQVAIQEGFTREYGIRVDAIGTDPSPTVEKVRMEQQIGMPIVDLVIHGITIPSQLKEMGYTVSPSVTLPETEKKGIWKMHPYGADSTKEVTVLVREIHPSIAINTQLVKPQNEPKSYQDLLDPRWKGQMVMTDPRVPGPGGMGFFAAMELGEGYWKKLAQQNVWLERKSGRAVDMLALGEKAILIYPSTTRAEVAIEAGASLKFIHMKEGSHSSTKGASLIKNAPHPHAAMVLLNWLVTRDGQIAIAKAAGQDTLRTDINPDWIKIPAFQPGAALSAFSRERITAEHVRETEKFADAIFGKR